MTRDEIRSAVAVFIELVRDEILTCDEAELTLPLVLDTLALAARELPDPDHQYVQASAAPYEATRELVAARFPNLGLYNTVQPLPVGGVEIETGDAIDDLADIYGDLAIFESQWRSQGPDAALRTLSANYDIHWGRHLRELQLYLHVHQR